MKLWVTRTAPDAHATAERLRALGHEPVVAPLLEVRTLEGVKPDLKGVTALAFTSRNGVAAFAGLTRRRNLPVYTVGEATAEAAREAGFGAVSSADGALAELVALIALHPPKGRLLWPGAAQPAGDLAAAVAPHGVECVHLPVYETVESALVAHPAVAEAAAVGRPDEIKGQAVVVFVTLKAGQQASDALANELKKHVGNVIGAIARPDDIRFTGALPKTRSGKIMRRLLKEVVAGGQVKGDTTTLEDFNVVAALQSSGKDDE